MSKNKSLSQYKYFKGETECPFTDRTKQQWWEFEKLHYENRTDQDFMPFFLEWIKEKAAPNSGYDLSKGNRWLDDYNSNIPGK